MKMIEAQKMEMSQVFSPDGRVTPVTLVSFTDFPSDLTPGTPVKVTGVSKGKGFAGVMKRHGFSGMPSTHGRSTKGRAPGSIGGTTTPGRVYKGKRMAGRMGGERVTVWGLSVVGVDPEKKIAKISGPLPGSFRGKLIISYEPKEESNQQPATGSEEQKESVVAGPSGESPEKPVEKRAGAEEKKSKEEKA